MHSATVYNLMEFLQQMIDKKYSYSAINSAKSAISLLISLKPQDQQLLKYFMKGSFHINPPKPKYNNIWDVSIVLEYLKSLGPNDKLSLKILTLKLTMLLALTSGQRVQTLAVLNLSSMIISEQKISFLVDCLLKTTSPSRKNNQIDFPIFHDKLICVVTCLHEYLNKTKACRQSDQLLVSYIFPHKEVQPDTISRWLKLMLTNAGIDTSIFSGHSTRSAAATCAAQKLDIHTILSSVGWKSAQTFHRFYYKTIDTKAESTLFASTVMEGDTQEKA